MRGASIVLIAGALLVPSAPAIAETYHVSTTGNDNAAGAEATPWRTLQHAADTVAPGDIVRVRAGTYAGFELETSGRAGAEIAFIAATGVNITSAAAGRDAGINLEGASYVRIEGFTVTGIGETGIRAVLCDHVTIRGNRADQNGVFGILTGFCDDLLIENNETSRSGEQHGIYVSNSGDRPVIRGNTSWGNNQNGIHMNGDAEQEGDGIITGALVERNVIYDNGQNGGSGINCDGVQSSTFQNNLLFNNHASGISLYRIDGGGASTGNTVVNNTIVMASDARWAINIQDESTGNRFLNNILLHANASRGAFDVCADCTTGLVSNHNVGVDRFSLGDQFITLAAWRTATGQDADFVASTAAALFTTASGTEPGDFALRDGSPALDHGVASGAPAVDLAGNPRPQGSAVDVGALERCDGPCMEPPAGTPDAGAGGRPDAGPPGPGQPDAAPPGPGEPDASPGVGAINNDLTGGCCDTGAGARGSVALSLLVMATLLRSRRRTA